MSDSDPIICKPTPWFLFRALVMLLMFGVFAVLFYIDGSTGYRKKNEVFYVYKTFEAANKEFAQMNSEGSLTPSGWKMHAEKQIVRFPEDASILPANLKIPMPWPAILCDYDRMKPLQWNKLWLEYSKERGFPSSPAEEPYDARKIREQWVVFWICLVLASAAGFFLLRTLGRKISADAQGITSQNGKRVAYADLKTLDLRKWETKGLAFIDYDGASGKGRIRIDGLTYGGFKKEQDEPAERLMRQIRSKFSGEILEYAPVCDQQGEIATAAVDATSLFDQQHERETTITANLSQNTVVPKTGLYYCTMCKEGDSALRDVLGGYAKSKGVDAGMLEGVFGAAGIGSNEPITRKTFKAGDRFGECPRHKQATGWTLEVEEASVTLPTVEQKEKIEAVMMECPPFPGHASCSDNECSCFNTTMPPAKGYLWIKQEVADTRMKCLSLAALQGFMTASGITSIDEVRRRCLPIVVCEQSAKRRGLDLTAAAADYTSWVNIGKVPCRPTPLA